MFKTMIKIVAAFGVGFTIMILILVGTAWLVVNAEEVDNVARDVELAIDSALHAEAVRSLHRLERDHCSKRNARLLSNARFAARVMAEDPELAKRINVERFLVALREGWCDIDKLKAQQAGR